MARGRVARGEGCGGAGGDLVLARAKGRHALCLHSVGDRVAKSRVLDAHDGRGGDARKVARALGRVDEVGCRHGRTGGESSEEWWLVGRGRGGGVGGGGQGGMNVLYD